MLTPEDVENKVFKRSLHGYDIDDVEDFLQELGEDFETLFKENIRAEKKISMLTDALQQTQKMKKQPLADTKPVNGNTVRNAEKQSEELLEKAKQQTDAELSEARKNLAEITYQYEQMKRSVEVFRAKVVALLDAQLSVIKDYSEVAIDEDTVNRAKALLEMVLPETSKKVNAFDGASSENEKLQDTAEISEPAHSKRQK